MGGAKLGDVLLQPLVDPRETIPRIRPFTREAVIQFLGIQR